MSVQVGLAVQVAGAPVSADGQARSVHAAHASPPARPPKRPAVLIPHCNPPSRHSPPPPSATGKLKLEPLLRDAELLASYAGPTGRDIVTVALEASGA